MASFDSIGGRLGVTRFIQRGLRGRQFHLGSFSLLGGCLSHLRGAYGSLGSFGVAQLIWGDA